jgi:integrase
MGSVRRTSSGRWQARWRPPGSHQPKGKTFDRKRDAEAFLARTEHSKLEGIYRDPNSGRIPFGPYMQGFLEGLRTPATRSLYTSIATNHIVPTFGNRLLASISVAEARSLIGELSRTGTGPASIEVAHKILSRVFRQAVQDDLIARNPASFVSVPKVQRKELRIPAPEEVGRIAGDIEPRFRALVLVGAFAGLRVGEATALSQTAVRSLERRIQITKAFSETRGYLAIREPKGKRRRSVPVPAFLIEELGRHIATYGESELLFTLPGSRPLRRSHFRRTYWVPALRRAGLEGVRFHDLRHHFAALAISQGAHPKAIQEWMGHSSINVTMDVYGHLFPSLEEEIAERMDGVGRAAVASPWPEDHERVIRLRESGP